MIKVIIGFSGVIIGALIGGGFNWFVNSRRIRADLKAKTRLEWIKEVRELTAEIKKDEGEIQNLINKYRNERSYDQEYNKSLNQDNFFIKFNAEVAIIKNRIETNIILYKLYFSKKKFEKKNKLFNIKTKELHKDNLENIEMHDLADKLLDEIEVLEQESINDANRNYKGEAMSKFLDKTSDYLKREWNKAKNNE